MRISEKTIELNFCAQFSAVVGRPLLWFGLTQRQEAQAGFDTCSRIGGRLLLFQFKASNYSLRSGDRRFYLKHQQLDALRTRAANCYRSVFYVFPFIGNTLELAKNPFILPNIGLLDVSQLTGVAAPTRRDGALRATGVHYVDVRRWMATIHSEPVDARLVPAAEFSESGLNGSDGISFLFEEFDDFWAFRRRVGGTAAAAIIY